MLDQKTKTPSTNKSNQELNKEVNDVVRKIKRICKKIEKANCSRKTKDEYQKIFKKYLDEFGTRSLLDLRTKSTYRKHKRALLACVRQISETILRKAKKKGTISQKKINTLKKLLELLELNGVLDPTTPCPIENPIPSKSKRKSLIGLPKNWLDIFWKGMPPQSQYRAQVAVLILTSARPEELYRKVSITTNRGKNQLVITIKGAKRGKDDTNGQETRWLSIPMDLEAQDGPAMYLFNKALADENLVWCEDTKRLYDFVVYWSRKFFGKRKHEVCPYSFRHQFAADIKADKRFDKEKIAELMGQRSDRTQKNYGSSKQSRGRRNITSCGASNRVRLHEQLRNFPSDLRSLMQQQST